MAKIKTKQQGGTVTITRAGATKRVHHVKDGVITVKQSEVADVLRLVAGSELVEGTLNEDDEVDTTTPPQLPPPAPGQPDPKAPKAGAQQ